jgi:TonB family protein
MLLSIAGHFLLFVFFLYGVHLLPSPEPLLIGSGPGGGQGGDFVSVGLAAEISGGEGMYKPPITPRPVSAPPLPERREEEKVETVQPEQDVFLEKKADRKKKKQTAKPKKKAKPRPSQETSGLIPREADPGKPGPPGGSAGSGGGFGTGKGVTIGSGTGEGVIDSWYIRQVEQRVGQNWLQTSLGNLNQRVDAIATFVVRANGQIVDVKLEKRSGVRSVDLAVQRAIQATNPLPPLPLEFRGRSVRFQAVFEYPPR